MRLVVVAAYCSIFRSQTNWKDATVAFKKHLQSKAHCEAVEAVVTLPKTIKDVGELIDMVQARDIHVL